MPRSRTQQNTYPVAPELVFGNAGTAMNRTFGNVIQSGPASYSSDAKLGMLSWGEDVTCEVAPAPSGSLVTVTSKAKMPTQVIDWGVHKKNITKVFAALESTLETSR